MATDRVADFLTRVRNAYKARLHKVACPASNLLIDICKVLEAEGFIKKFDVETEGNKRSLLVELKYIDGEPAMREVKRVSKSGLRKYSSVSALPKHYNGLGISILTTSKGVMSDFAARQAHVGGEILCTVF